MDLHENFTVPIFSPAEMLRPTTRNNHIETTTRYVEAYFFGEKAKFARQAFGYINDRFFHGQLPWTLIIWGLTAHGKCLAHTVSSLNEPPKITLHPSIFRPGQRDKLSSHEQGPWGMPRRYLGPCYAFDVLLHECMHVSVNYLLGGREGGDSSHNCPAWIGEVNRIAPMLGFHDVRAEMKKPTRVKGETKIKRIQKGNIELDILSRFPGALRSFYQDFSFYEKRILPWE